MDADDGVDFQPGTVRAEEIRKEANYSGIRIRLVGLLAGARCAVQVDVGFGDAVTPAPEQVEYPALLPELPRPILRAYPRYTVVAEKFEAMVTLGIANSRMKDYFDLWILARHTDFDGEILRHAIHATFSRRGTLLPSAAPFGLSDEFARDQRKQVQWKAFQRKNGLTEIPLSEVIASLREFFVPLLQGTEGAHHHWRSDEGWSDILP